MISDQQTNLSTDMAIHLTREFLKQMAQPWSKEEQLGTSLWYTTGDSRFGCANTFLQVT